MRARLFAVGGLALAAVGLISLGLAFTRGAAPDGAAASIALDPSIIKPVRTTIRSVLVLDGVVAEADPIPLRAPKAGILTEFSVAIGATVTAGQSVAVMRDSKGTRFGVFATVAGVLSSSGHVAGERVNAGDVMAIVAPAAFVVEAVVQPEQLYRLYAAPSGITVAIDHGPAPFECPFASIGANAGEDPISAPVYLKCSIPEAIRAFPGVRVRLAVTTGVAEAVLTVPVEAVEGAADVGRVWIVGPDGRTRPQPVSLGLTDGVRIEVVKGLTPEDQILEFPPADELGVFASPAP